MEIHIRLAVTVAVRMARVIFAWCESSLLASLFPLLRLSPSSLALFLQLVNTGAELGYGLFGQELL